MQMMRARILVCVCAFMSCDVQTHTASVKDSSEQSALQEALLLVELLKSEYARVLRGNSLIKEGQVDERDLQTCAPTTVPTDVVTHTQTDKPVQHIKESSTEQTLKPYTAHGSNRFYYSNNRARNRRRNERRSTQAARSYYYDFPRRRINGYRDYGSYGPAESWRRMDYENIFGPQPGQTNSTIGQPNEVNNSESQQTLSSISTTTSTTVSEMPISSILSNASSSPTTLSSTTISAASPDTVTTSETTLKSTEPSLTIILSSTTLQVLTSSTAPSTTHLINKQSTLISTAEKTERVTIKNTQTKEPSVTEKVKLKRKKLLLPVEKTTVTSTNEPEQAQVAAELENELQGGIESSSSSRRWSLTWRPSTRVHLARSTPYHLPLPENHAFCYTNPESSLCRTFIK